MNRNGFNFTQPYWEFALPLLSWVFLLPLLFWSENGHSLVLGISGIFKPLISKIESNVGVYVLASSSVTLLSWSVGAIISSHELLKKRNFLPAGFAAFFGSMAILIFGFSLSYLAVFFYIQALSSLMYVRRESQSFSQIYNMGFLVALGILFDIIVAWSLLFLLSSLLTLRKLSIRDLFIFLVGIFNVLFIVVAVFFLLTDLLPSLQDLTTLVQFGSRSFPDVLIYCFLGSVGFVLLIGVLSSENYISSLNNRAKYRFRILGYLSLVIAILVAIWRVMMFSGFEFSFAIPPLALVATVYATGISNRWWRRIFVLASLMFFTVWISFFLV